MTAEADREPVSLPNLAWLKKLGNTVVDLLFPPRCVGCQRFGAWLCDRCLDAIERIHPPVCPRCGWPLESSPPFDPDASGRASSGYHRCHESPAQPDRLLACAFHAGPLREAIHRLKYENLRVMAVPLGRLMAQAWTELAPADQPIDAIVPVPLHVSRERERGYNQATLLARELSLHLGRPMVEDTLVRTRHTRAQVGLDPKARQANVRGAFACVNTRLTGSRVLLVDDVCTTSSTLGAASSALREGGVSSVWAYTLARARLGTGPVADKPIDEESGKWN